MKLTTLPDERFTCSCCANCCHNWHVELVAGEPERIAALQWPDGTAPPQPFFLKHNGRTYLAHLEDRGCVFLNRGNNLCSIHEQFGLDAKPLGCQLYPFHITPLDDRRAFVGGRYDCPIIRGNTGAPHEAALPELRRLEPRLHLDTIDSPADQDQLDVEQIEAVDDFIGTMLAAFDDDRDRALFIHAAGTWLATQQADTLDRALLGQAFPVLREYVLTQRTITRKPGVVHRMAFRTLLGMYLRRDEDVLDGQANRFARLGSMTRLVMFGSIDLASLGAVHPHGSLAAAKLFMPAIGIEPNAFALHWRLMRNKLFAAQYFAATNGGCDIVTGLRSLAMLFPLVVAVAKYHAARRNASVIEASDVDGAVAAIEHAFGRGAVGALPVVRSLERSLAEPTVFARLVRTI